MNEYEQRANDFARKYGVKLSVLDKEYRPYFPGERDERWCYKCRISRNGKSYTFWFGQSIASGDKRPTFYDIFSCFEKYDPGDFYEFCSEFGYSDESRSAERIWKACCKEYAAVERLFGDVMEEFVKFC